MDRTGSSRVLAAGSVDLGKDVACSLGFQASCVFDFDFPRPTKQQSNPALPLVFPALSSSRWISSESGRDTQCYAG